MKESNDVKRKLSSNIFFVLSHMKKWHPESIIILILNTIAVAVAPFIWVVVPKLVIDELEATASINRVMVILSIAMIVAGLVYFTKEACVGVYRMKMSRVRMLFGLELHEKAMELPYRYVEDSDTQTLLNRATRTTSNPNRGIGGVMKYAGSIVGYILGFVGYTGILLSLHPLVLLYLMLSVYIVYRLRQQSNNYEYEKEEKISFYGRKAKYLSRTMTDFEFGKDTRIYSLKTMLLAKMADHHKKEEKERKDVLKKRFQVNFIDALLVLLRDGIVLGYITYKVLKGEMGFGNFIFYVTAVSGFAVWMQTLMSEFTELKLCARYVDDYRNFMTIEGGELTETKISVPSGDRLSIEFDDVSFKYPGTEKTVFDHLSLEIPAGQKLAVVGINGAGKSTLIKLLTGLYRPNSGVIRIDDIDTSKLSLTSLYQLFSVVFQEIKPLAGSIAQNVASSEIYDEQKVRVALERAGLMEKVESLDKRIETPLLKIIEDDGLELSGGENQKLALARALYKNGPIVILDEPTAALDPVAEKNIYESFSDMIDGRTAIFISHRLSSTKFCDKVAYFENGVIAEYGTHDELMLLGGKYAHMFHTQAQYYQSEEVGA